jgi:hypothetical protein
MWRYNRPKTAGYYYCTLIARTNTKTVAYGDTRFFGIVDNLIDEYRMEGEPLDGLGWIRDADGYRNETVLAWSEDEIEGVCEKLPEGAIVVKIEDSLE